MPLSHILVYSFDRKTWTQSNFHLNTPSEFIKYSTGILLINNERFGLYYSTNGIDWNECKNINVYIFTVHYANGLWVAVSRDGGIFYSITYESDKLLEE